MIRKTLLVLTLFAGLSGLTELTAQQKVNIWDAAQNGKLDRVRTLLDGKPGLLNTTDSSKRTPLHLATRYGHLDIVKLLLARGAAPDQHAYNNFTPLYMAVRFNRPQILDLLLQQKINLNTKTSFGRTAIDIAARDNRQKLIDRLLAAGANYTLFTAACHGDKMRVATLLKPAGRRVMRSTLVKAFQGGHAEIAVMMLPRLQNPMVINNMFLHPLLFEATKHVAVVKALITAGVDPDERSDGQGLSGIPLETSVLHYAAIHGHVETIAHLLALEFFDKGDVTDSNGRTPAHNAAAFGQLAALQMLHSQGASLQAKDNRGRTCVHFAAEPGHAHILRWLVKQGNVLHDHDDAGRSALLLATKGIHPTEKRVKQRLEAAWVLVRRGVTVDLYSAAVIGDTASAKALLETKPELAKAKGILVRAISFGNLDIVTLLLDAGCDANMLDKSKMSPLHWAALWRKAGAAQLLLDRGAAVHATTKSGYTPLHDAARADCVPVAKALLAAGAKLDAKDNDGKTPRGHLTSHSSDAMRKLLK